VWQGVKIGFDGDRIEALLKQIEDDISRIANLTHRSIELEPLRQERRLESHAQHWRDFRDRAKRIFDFLSARWSCETEHEHRVRLRLQTRRASSPDDVTKERFELILSFDGANVNPPSNAWEYHNIEVESSKMDSTDE